MASTLGRIRRIARSCDVPNTFLMAQVSIVSLAKSPQFRSGRDSGNVAAPGPSRNVCGPRDPNKTGYLNRKKGVLARRAARSAGRGFRNLAPVGDMNAGRACVSRWGSCS